MENVSLPENANEHEWPPRLLTAAEVAAILRVDIKVPSRWLREGKMKDVRCVRTPGGHLRFFEEDIYNLVKSKNNVDLSDTPAPVTQVTHTF